MQNLGKTVREAPVTVPEFAATVREQAATVRESAEPSTPLSAPAQGQQVAAWLPASLAAEYDVIEPLPARGGEADLYVVEARNPSGRPGGTVRRVAKVHRQDIQPKKDVVRLVQSADPAHVVRLESYGQDAGRWWELMEHVRHGSLHDLLQVKGPRLAPDLVLEILRQLNAALTSLHQLPMEHRNLKPGNVLLRSRTPLELVLTDFGSSSVMEASMHFTVTARTIKYAPPEAIGSIVSDESTRRSIVVIERITWDYWSLGMMVIEMLVGEHPFDGLSEAVISHQLATQNVEQLTEGVADPHWLKLCRGLLRRTPSSRWDAEAVEKWIAAPDDPSLEVAAERAVAQPYADSQPSATIDFDGVTHASTADLGAALASDWAKAESFWKRRFADVRDWVIDGLGLRPLGDALVEIDDSDLPLDTQVFNCIYHLAPNAPLRFRDVESLVALGERAVNQSDHEARGTLPAMYRQRILTQASSLPDSEGLAEVAQRWERAVAEYRRIRDGLRERHQVEAPELGDDFLVRLLAGSTPGSPIEAKLREETRRVSTKDAPRCRWFRVLGQPDTMAIPALSMLPHLHAEAQQQGRIARMAPIRGCIGGAAVGALCGMQVRWADERRGEFAPSGFFDFFDVLSGSVLLAMVIVTFLMAARWHQLGTSHWHRLSPSLRLR